MKTEIRVPEVAENVTEGKVVSLLVAKGDSVEVDQNQLLGIKAQEVVQVEEKQICTIKTRRGADVVETEIPCTN